MIYFTSDLHLGHHNIIKMQQRPFASTQEMNEALIATINQIVLPQDTLYILGDISHRLNTAEVEALVKRIRCHKVLIWGNHDKHTLDPRLFHHMDNYEELHVRYNGRKYLFVLSHYPFEHWNKEEGGSIHLHGHCHGNHDYNLKQLEAHRLRYDVGVDANDYKPVSLADIIAFFDLNER